MTEQAKTSGKVMSDRLRIFFYRRIKELIGISLVFCAICLCIILLTASALDPSSNVAADGEIKNWFGPFGALLSNQLISWFGFFAVLFPVSLFIWGIRIFAHRGVSLWIWRLCLLPLSIQFLSAGIYGLGFNFRGIASVVFGMFLPLMDSRIDSLGIDKERALALILVFIGIVLYVWSTALGKKEAVWVYRFGKFIVSPLLKLFSVLRRSKSEKIIDLPAMAIAKSSENTPKKTTSASARKTPTLRTKKAAKTAATRKGETQVAFNFDAEGNFQLPPAYLLKPPSKVSSAPAQGLLEENAEQLETVLSDFRVQGEITDIRHGPVVTRYDLEPAPGIKSQRVIALADDIARSMSALAVRVAVVPGQNVIGIELPNDIRQIVLLRDLLDSQEWTDQKANLPVALGMDIAGSPIIVDLGKMPHLLVAGTTGSGKSVGINAMILSLLYKHTPDSCRLIMIDPKMLELSVYDGIPHLLTPVVTDPAKAIMALKWAVREMESRYRNMAKIGVRNITSYNERLAQARAKGEVISRRVQTGFDQETGRPVFEEDMLDLTSLPYIVVVIDEVADLMLVAGKEIEAAVQRLAQMARAAGIHVIMATQRPSVDVITGTIKANFPTRISFQVTSRIDSRTILGEQGAEQLLGKGDMLYMEGGGRVTRVHGPFVDDDEVEQVVSFLRQQGEPEYDEKVTEEITETQVTAGGGSNATQTGEESLYEQAVALVIREQRASTSFVQRHLRIGYNRAATLIEEMEAAAIISKANHVGKREVLVSNDES
ncbi:MAG: cell division protein FtsK [Alphaproteobacteria bacterium]|nr:cell division protein FtsK [Alphaproteobacteria bacterium]